MDPLAHGLGGAKDLPISLELMVSGAVAALVVSFTVLAVAWRNPRFDAATSGKVAPGWIAALVGSRAFSRSLSLLGLVFFGYLATAAVLGPNTLINPFIGSMYVLLWVGIVPASLLFGPFFKAVSPARAINRLFARLSGRAEDQGLFAFPERIGYWPAAFGLFAFVWLELVSPTSTDLGTLRLWFAVYLAAMVSGSALFGGRFLESADPFEVYSTLVSRLSVWGYRDDVLVLRSPLANLDTVSVRPGLVAVVGVLFGSTAFDSFRESQTWLQYVQSIATERIWPDTAALFAFSAGTVLLLVLATMATGVDAETPRRQLPNLFAHSVIPIIVGYMVAHYLSYFVHQGQRTLIDLSDPLGTGANLLGTANMEVNYWLMTQPTLLAVLKVLAVVCGHVLGVIAAHDRATKLLPARHQLTGQLPLLFAMVALTAGGLFLLFSS